MSEFDHILLTRGDFGHAACATLPRMRIWVCGVRGSTPTPGPAYARHGGHTSCVAIGHDGERPSLILDAGTGIRNAADLFNPGRGLFDGNAYDGSILFGHLHWDHTQGLPFFAAGNNPDSRVDVYLPAQGEAEEILARFMSPPHFPIAPSELLGKWRFLALDPGEHEIEGFSVLALEIPHKGGRAFGYRITSDGKTLAYLSDHCPMNLGPGPDGLGEYHEAALRLVTGCDLVFHDAQYTDAELPERAAFGHSSVGYAVRLASQGGVGRLMLYHHDPGRTDEQVDEILASCQGASIPVSAAVEGTIIDL